MLVRLATTHFLGSAFHYYLLMHVIEENVRKNLNIITLMPKIRQKGTIISISFLYPFCRGRGSLSCNYPSSYQSFKKMKSPCLSAAILILPSLAHLATARLLYGHEEIVRKASFYELHSMFTFASFFMNLYIWTFQILSVHP